MSNYKPNPLQALRDVVAYLNKEGSEEQWSSWCGSGDEATGDTLAEWGNQLDEIEVYLKVNNFLADPTTHQTPTDERTAYCKQDGCSLFRVVKTMDEHAIAFVSCVKCGSRYAPGQDRIVREPGTLDALG